MAIKLTISGFCGRMGRSIASLAMADPAFSIAAALEGKGHEAFGRNIGDVLGVGNGQKVSVIDNARKAISQGDVLIEFTTPKVSIEHVKLAEQLKKSMVIGTTGLSEEQLAILRAASKRIAIVFSPNMSLGVNVLFELARQAAEKLGRSFDIEIVEHHHRHKKDSPSGTAKRLADVLASASKQSKDSVPVHAIRAGSVIGEHTVILSGPSERVELTHRAQSREVFAQGSLRAAQFVAKASPGFYDMSHVLAKST